MCIAQQTEEEEEAEYYDGEYDNEYEEYDYEGCSKYFSKVWKHVISLSKPVFLHKYIFSKMDSKQFGNLVYLCLTPVYSYRK